ncbi:unnamed protein product, partial [marine sediment metagenome]
LSQALTAFRHRFMRQKIYIHGNPQATELERLAYFGGRTECFFIGRKTSGPFYKLDVNSMYPAIMSKLSVPVKFIRMYKWFDVSKLKFAIKRWAVVADVVIETRKRCYPVRGKDGLIFPIGKFRTALCGPELALALRHGDIVSVDRLAVYRKRVIFDRFVTELYAIRQQYERAGNPVFAEMTKRLMNTLYGKFGQHNEQWEYLGHFPQAEDGVWTVYDEETGEHYQERCVFGHVFRQVGMQDAYHSFAGISAYITS